MIAPPWRQAGPARWAWGMCAVSFGLAVAAMALAGLNGESPNGYITSHHAIGTVTALFFAPIGALIVARERGNLLGWILCVDGVLLGVFNVAQQYAPIALGLTEDRYSVATSAGPGRRG
jgi:hypothetical protein